MNADQLSDQVMYAASTCIAELRAAGYKRGGRLARPRPFCPCREGRRTAGVNAEWAEIPRP